MRQGILHGQSDSQFIKELDEGQKGIARMMESKESMVGSWGLRLPIPLIILLSFGSMIMYMMRWVQQKRECAQLWLNAVTHN